MVQHGLADFDLYPYNPSATAAYLFLALFALATAIHLFLAIWNRSYFFLPFLLGCLAECGGYYGRAWSHDNIRLGSPYLLQFFLIILATPLLSATLYMSLARLSRSLTTSRNRMRWTTALYIILDIGCLVLQIMGTVMQAYGTGDDKKNSTRYIAGGLILQLLAFLLFMLLAWRLQRKISREPSFVSAHPRAPRWRRCFGALYAASLLVLIRNLVRVIEFVQGSESVILRHEAFLYVFDATPMFLLVVVVAAFHPGRVVRFVRKIEKESKRQVDDVATETVAGGAMMRGTS